MKRHYAHLSQTEKTALTVGRKHGKPIVLYIDTKAMHEEGYKFYLRLFQNFSFWNSFLEFSGKTGLLPVFPGAWFKTNRVLEQA
ncbi:MAG: RNA 2'-phosphotransferase, partial [Treponema sp.]|nr:RNA 2'-phosphotransferase [Treponema sp.]